VLPVIMAGGSGTRLWPLSRAGYPKQFLVLSGNNRSLFQQAVRACRGWPPTDHGGAPLVVGNEEHRFLVLDQLRELPARTRRPCCWSPMGRNTAPAVTLAALQALEGGADPVLVVTPADQTVTDGRLHRRAAARRAVAAQGAIVILGITPTAPRPATATSAAWRTWARRQACGPVRREARPGHRRALPGRGGYFWNAGMFVLQGRRLDGGAGALPARHRRRLPRGLGQRSTDARFVRPGKAEFAAVPASRWTTR
jgi:mannose-1-phosphate guanylyltransferase/mannose-6-phosphate isomerase